MQFIRTYPLEQVQAAVPSAGSWKTIGRGPHATTMGIALDTSLRFPIIHRSNKVRSAKDCWSLPSGLHENGLTLVDQLAVELKEELKIEVVSYNHVYLGYYENISVEDSYHWVIHVYAVLADLSKMENLEPDKHDQVELVHVNAMDEYIKKLRWAPGLGEFLARRFNPSQMISLVEQELKAQ